MSMLQNGSLEKGGGLAAVVYVDDAVVDPRLVDSVAESAAPLG